MVGSNFVGLIFSVFVSSNHTNTQKTDLIAFQSYTDLDGKKKARTIKVTIIDAQTILMDVPPFSKHDFYDNVQNVCNFRLLTVVFIDPESAYSRGGAAIR